jgi:hypothetical protein
MEGQRWELKAFLQQSPAVEKGRNGQFCENITDLVASRGIRAVKILLFLLTTAITIIDSSIEKLPNLMHVGMDLFSQY